PLEVSQSHLKKIVCLWNKRERLHAMLLPVFESNHRVRGMIALSSSEAPVWYPGIPISARQGRITFKTGMEPDPLPLLAVERDTWAGTFCMDSNRWLERFLPRFGIAGGYLGPVNLEGGKIRGMRVLDVIYESGLHRVRWIKVRAGWFHTRKLSLLDLPPLSEVLEAAPVIPPVMDEISGEPYTGEDSTVTSGMSDSGAALQGPPGQSNGDGLAWGPSRRRGMLDQLIRGVRVALKTWPSQGR
ncbi:MAG TPA: hypothetical protein VLB09_00250, partial [Nitrospiria bacterium]|nr:hypothetical protein [Nitrospiria bacterium]